MRNGGGTEEERKRNGGGTELFSFAAFKPYSMFLTQFSFPLSNIINTYGTLICHPSTEKGNGKT